MALLVHFLAFRLRNVYLGEISLMINSVKAKERIPAT